MAKRRIVTKSQRRAGRSDKVVEAATAPSAATSIDPSSIATGLLGGAIVYVSYYPSDSVAVERGDALWFGMLAIVIATIVWSAEFWRGIDGWCDGSDQTNGCDGVNDRFSSKLASRALDILPWLLAGWMMLAAFTTAPPGNLRMGTNEAWLWVAAAAIFTSARRLMSSAGARQATWMLIVVCASGLAVHGLHQYFVSLPANRAEYRSDPPRVLELAGIDAPPGSAERMVFENRLFDGGPTGTFALANSLAAVLLFGVILALGVLRFQWHALSVPRRAAWGTLALLCAGCLMAARSRSALMAMLIALALILICSSRLRSRNPRALVLGLAGISVLGIACAAFLALLGNREWFEEAPASLEFRLQYWRSTWQMVLDHPWFGAGPGNFQSIYERYREASATEQIAEPHNLLIETLASGGFVGLGAVLMMILCGFVVVTLRRGEHVGGTASPEDDRGRWLWLGAVLAVSMVWLIGWVSRHPPDFQASLFVLPVCIATALVLWPSVTELASADLDSILGVALVAISIHLMVAGGWTVPGVATMFWVSAATLTRVNRDVGETTLRSPMMSVVIAGCGLILLATLYLMSLRPVENQARLMATAAMAQSSGQVGKARMTLERAADSDPWSSDAMLWLADLYRWQVISDPSNSEARQQWQTCLSEAKQRAGDDPAVYRMIGAQQLHVFQRHGEAVDLTAAADTFEKAVHWSPANQWMMAQMAVVARARGEDEVAERLANRAAELSQLGGNIERALSRQQVYEARHIGRAADRGPVRRAASELLPEPNAGQYRTGQHNEQAD